MMIIHFTVKSDARLICILIFFHCLSFYENTERRQFYSKITPVCALGYDMIKDIWPI